MTFHCPVCLINWYPYMTHAGTCMQCGSGTRQTQEPASDNVEAVYRTMMAARFNAELHERFEDYYLRREVNRPPDAFEYTHVDDNT
jgi:hypothetical protein